MRLRLKIGQITKEKGERRFREMEIRLEVQQEIEEGRIPSSALGGISISEVLTELRNEPGESKTLPYF